MYIKIIYVTSEGKKLNYHQVNLYFLTLKQCRMISFNVNMVMLKEVIAAKVIAVSVLMNMNARRPRTTRTMHNKTALNKQGNGSK